MKSRYWVEILVQVVTYYLFLSYCFCTVEPVYGWNLVHQKLRTRPRAGQLRNCVSIPGRRERFSSFPKRPGRLWGSFNLISRYLSRFAHEREADNSASSSARLGMNWAVSPLPVCLRGVQRDSFTSTDCDYGSENMNDWLTAWSWPLKNW
jgi:hypothetical protein